MGKVYIVTEGCYSDYCIVAAFSERGLADALVEKLDAGEYPEVEEYELDLESPKNPLWTVHMNWNGDTECVWSHRTLRADEDEWYITALPPKPGGESHLVVKCYAKDKKHAVKIVNERRAMLIAENKGEPHQHNTN